MLGVCAGHGTELVGWKSPHQVFAEPKARRRARASSRGEVWRKPNPKARGDEQEPDMRCGTLGASGHVTMKPSIRKRGVLYKSGVHAQEALCLTPGDLLCALGSRVRLKLAEGREIDPDRMGEVSRGHISRGNEPEIKCGGLTR